MSEHAVPATVQKEASQQTAHIPDPTESIERWKVLYDLSIKQWHNSYHDLPSHVKDKGYRLITLYTASIAVLAALANEVLPLMRRTWESGVYAAAILLAVTLLAAAFLLGIAIYYIVKAVFDTRTYATVTCEEIKGHVENPEFTDPDVYRIVTNHLHGLSKTNLGLVAEIVQDTGRSLRIFYVAVAIGFVLFLCTLIQRYLS